MSLEHCVKLESLGITLYGSPWTIHSMRDVGVKILRSCSSNVVAQTLELGTKSTNQLHKSRSEAGLSTLGQLAENWLAGIKGLESGDAPSEMQEMKRTLRIRIPDKENWWISKMQVMECFQNWSELGQFRMHHSRELSINPDLCCSFPLIDSMMTTL